MIMAICDDNPIDSKSLHDLVTLYYSYKMDLNIISYENGITLIDDIKSGTFFDVIFLDIYMPAMTGMMVAEEIRTIDPAVMIVFVTCAADFAILGYNVEAISFLIKPVTKAILYPLLDKISDRIDCKRQTIDIFYEQTYRKLFLSDIMYIERIKKKVNIHMVDGEIIPTSHALYEFEEKLNHNHEFCMPYQAHIINMHHITSVKKKERLIFMRDGADLPISRDKVKMFMDQYLLSMVHEL